MKLINSFWTVIIISVSVALIVLSFGFFREYKPLMTQAQYDRDFRDQEQAEADKMPQAKKRKQKAIDIVKAKSAAWNQYVETKTPPTSLRAGGIDVSEDPYSLTRDTFVFRNSIQKAVNRQLKMGGVQLVGNGPQIPVPTDVNNVGGILSSYYHYPGIKFPVVIFNLGTITVTGTYDQIVQHIKAYKTMPNYLAMTDGLQITGTAPKLTANYTLSIVGFIRGTKVFGSIPEAQAASTGGFGGGGGMAGFGRAGGGGGRGAGMGPMGPGAGGPPGMRGPGGGGAPSSGKDSAD